MSWIKDADNEGRRRAMQEAREKEDAAKKEREEAALFEKTVEAILWRSMTHLYPVIHDLRNGGYQVTESGYGYVLHGDDGLPNKTISTPDEAFKTATRSFCLHMEVKHLGNIYVFLHRYVKKEAILDDKELSLFIRLKAKWRYFFDELRQTEGNAIDIRLSGSPENPRSVHTPKGQSKVGDTVTSLIQQEIGRWIEERSRFDTLRSTRTSRE